jgi:hypothetical protein
MQGRRIGPQLIALPQGFHWPGDNYQIESLQVLIPDTPLTSLEELTKAATAEAEQGRGRGTGGSQRGQFDVIDFKSADWSYRIERGSSDNPGTLLMTPTGEAVEKFRATLVEIDQAREAAEKARVESAKKRAEWLQQQRTAAAPDEKGKSSKDDK